MLIMLGDGCAVSVDEISEVKINPTSDTITVRMKSGVGHSVMRDYGGSIYAKFDSLVAEINKQRTAYAGESE